MPPIGTVLENMNQSISYFVIVFQHQITPQIYTARIRFISILIKTHNISNSKYFEEITHKSSFLLLSFANFYET